MEQRQEPAKPATPDKKLFPTNIDDRATLGNAIYRYRQAFEKRPLMLDEYRRQARKSNARGFISNRSLGVCADLYSTEQKKHLGSAYSQYVKTINKESSAWREAIRVALDFHYGITRLDSESSEERFDEWYFHNDPLREAVREKLHNDQKIEPEALAAPKPLVPPKLVVNSLGDLNKFAIQAEMMTSERSGIWSTAVAEKYHCNKQAVDEWLRQQAGTATNAALVADPTAQGILLGIQRAQVEMHRIGAKLERLVLTDHQLEQFADMAFMPHQNTDGVSRLCGIPVTVIPTHNTPKTKESTMSNVHIAATSEAIEVKTVVRINNRDAKTYSKGELYSMIADQQAAIKTLETVDPKPKSLVAEIDKRKKGIDDLVAYMDSLDN